MCFDSVCVGGEGRGVSEVVNHAGKQYLSDSM